MWQFYFEHLEGQKIYIYMHLIHRNACHHCTLGEKSGYIMPILQLELYQNQLRAFYKLYISV